MKQPNLHFTWIGEPRFAAGGQDVIGPSSFSTNFNTFYSSSQPRPNMKFWCQEEYADDYRNYFSKHEITIEVCAIGAYLVQHTEQSPYAKVLINHYQELLANPARNHILDRILFKDPFVYFLLATEGGYTLDTNVQALADLPVYLPEYPNFRFPYLEETDELFGTGDVWILYSPPHDPRRAQACLEKYFTLYEQKTKFVELYSKKHHMIAGEIAVSALLLTESRPFYNDQDNPLAQVWKCQKFIKLDVEITNLGVTKEYYNSHYFKQEHRYGAPHMHVYYNQLTRLRWDLEHGIHVDVTNNPSQLYQPTIALSAENQTLLHLAVLTDCETNSYACIRLLLKHGADPNRIHRLSINHSSPTTPELIEESAVTLAIKMRTQPLLALLFSDSQAPIAIDRIIDNKSLLLLAAEERCGLETILAQGADPNQIWEGQTKTPLMHAILTNNIEAVSLLLSFGALPNLSIKHHPDLVLCCSCDKLIPLHLALAVEDPQPEIVKKLLQAGASLSEKTSYWIDGKKYSFTPYNIPTSDACRSVVHPHPLRQHQNSIMHRVFRFFKPSCLTSSNARDQHTIPMQDQSDLEGLSAS